MKEFQVGDMVRLTSNWKELLTFQGHRMKYNGRTISDDDEIYEPLSKLPYFIVDKIVVDWMNNMYVMVNIDTLSIKIDIRYLRHFDYLDVI